MAKRNNTVPAIKYPIFYLLCYSPMIGLCCNAGIDFGQENEKIMGTLHRYMMSDLWNIAVPF
jgi:hypothetical protein